MNRQIPGSREKVCRNCKFNFRWEDNYDTNSEDGIGQRVGFRCGHPFSPVIHTVVERESNPSMRESTCYIHAFGCSLWKLNVDTEHINDFPLGAGETLLMTSVRNIRRLGLEPSLTLSHSSFTALLNCWPRFYLTGSAMTCTRGNLYSWLRRLFVGKKRMPLSLSVRFSDEALGEIRDRMLKEQAIPIDGVWVPVSVSDR